MERKPHNLPLKDFLISLTVAETALPEELCYNIINWIYKDTKEAAHKYREIELSGFGKLLISQNKVKKRKDKFTYIKNAAEKKYTETKAENWEKRMASANEMLEFLNSKEK